MPTLLQTEGFRFFFYSSERLEPPHVHLDLSPPEKPPPELRDVVRAPVDDEGREMGQVFVQVRAAVQKAHPIVSSGTGVPEPLS